MDTAQIPYFVHEGAMARMERTNKRLWILVLILVIALVGTNAGWIAYESQFETYDISQDVDTGNGSANVAGIGDVYGYTSENQGTGIEDKLP